MNNDTDTMPDTVYIRSDGDGGIEFTDNTDSNGFEFTNRINPHISALQDEHKQAIQAAKLGLLDYVESMIPADNHELLRDLLKLKNLIKGDK